MIDANILKKLNHFDSEQRKKAVMDLAKTKDREALNYLAGVYRNDKDLEVRELARKAGLYINKHSGNGNDAKRKNDSFAFGDEDDDDDIVPKSKGTYYEEADIEDTSAGIVVSQLDQERAMGLVKQALDIHMRGNNDRAMKYLQDALKKDPNLKRDSYTAGLATTITGLPSEEAFRQITSDTLDNTPGDKKKKRSAVQPDEPGWGSAIVDLLIYMLINTGLVALAIFVFAGVFLVGFSEALAASAASSQFSSTPFPIDISTIVSTLTGIGIPLIFLYSAIIGLLSTILLIIQLFFIHIVSVMMLSGDGTLPRLITKTTVPLAIAYPIYYLVGAGIALYGIVSPEAGGTTTVLQFALSIGLGVWYANRVGVAYRFGTNTGGLAIFLGAIAMFACACVAALVLPSLLASSVTPNGF